VMPRLSGVAFGEAGHPSWHWMVVVSIVLHGVGLLAVWGLERYTPRRSFDPTVISVRLVGAVPSASMSPAPQSSSQAQTQSRPTPPPEKATTSQSRIPLPVPQAERKAVSINPTDVKTPERTPPPVPKVETPPPPAPKAPSSGKGASQGGADVGPKVAAAATGGGGGGNFTAEEAQYLQMLQERIHESWTAYVGPEEGEVLVRIQISPDGRIREFTFLKGSGKSFVDSSIVSALKKVALPPPPASLADRPLPLRFLPSGPKP